MALRMSTGLRDDMLGLVATIIAFAQGTDYTITDGGGGDDSIVASAGNLETDGFTPGDVLRLEGASTPQNDTNFTGAIINSMSVDGKTIYVDTALAAPGEAFLAITTLLAARGGSLKDVFKDGVLRIYSGAQPASPDNAVNGSLLVEISLDAGTFAADDYEFGIEFELEAQVADGELEKESAETWQGVGAIAGTAAWFRLVGNPADTGLASTTLPRVDGTVGASGADLNMSNTAISVGATYTVDTFKLSLPLQYGG